MTPDLQCFFNEALIKELFGNIDHQAESKPLDLGKIQRLLDTGANIDLENDNNLTIFMAVIVTDRICDHKKNQIIRLFLTYKPNIEHQDIEGKTAFYCAAERDNADLMILLFDAGAHIDVLVNGKTVFAYALENNLEQTTNCFYDIINKKLIVQAIGQFEASLATAQRSRKVSLMESSSGESLCECVPVDSSDDDL